MHHHALGAFGVLEVAHHHLAAANQDHARLACRQRLVRLGVHDQELGTRERHAHRARLVVHLHGHVVAAKVVLGVDRCHRSRLGTAVPFVNFFAELETERGHQFRAQGLGTGDNQAHILERHRVYVTANRKRTQECRGRNKRRHAEFRTNSRHRLHIGRVGHRHDGAPFRKVQKRRHRKAKAMEQREFREHHVGARHVENTGELLDVAHEVPVAQHHTLGRAFGTGTEHDGRNAVERHALAEAELDKPARGEHAEHEEERNLRLRDFLHEIFSVEQTKFIARNLGVIVPAAFQFLDELAARNHGLHVGPFGTELHVVDRRGVVQIHVRLAQEPKSEVHDDSCGARREHDAHVIFVGTENLLQVPAERDNRTHQFVTGEVPSIGIVNSRAILDMALVRTDPAIGNRVNERNGIAPSINRNLTDNGADLVGRSGGRNRFTEGNRHDAFRRSAVHVGVAIAVVTAPKPLDVEGQHLGIRPLDHLRVVDGKRFDVRGLGNFAGGEKHNRAAFQQSLVDAVHGRFLMAGVVTDNTHALEQGAQVPFFEVVLARRDSERTRGGHLHHGPVDKAVVVADQENRAIVRDVLHTEDTNLVLVENKAQDRANQSLGQIGNSPDKHAYRNNGQTDKVKLRRNRRIVAHPGEQEQERDQHDRLDQISKRKDPARIVRTRIVLEQGVHRHKEHATAETDKRVQDSECNRMHEERDEEHADRDKNHAQRNEPGLNEVLGFLRRKDGAQHETHHRERQHVLDHVDVVRTGKVLEHEYEHLSHSPEHREGDNRGPERGMTPADAELAAGLVEIQVQVLVADLGHKETCDRTQDADSRQDPRDNHRPRNNHPDRLVGRTFIEFNEVHGNNNKARSKDNAYQRENLEKSVRVAQVADAKHLLEDRVLGHAVNGKTRRKTNGKPEGNSRAPASHKDRHCNNKSRHEQGRPSQDLVLRELVGQEPGWEEHQYVGGDKEYLKHEALPNLATFPSSERPRQDFLCIDKYAHLHKGHCENG